MKNVLDIYAVSPMQEAMLLHSVAQSDRDTLFNQFCYHIDSVLDAGAFQQAWQEVVARHTALRTAFIWEGVKYPQQVVRKAVKLPFLFEDWRDKSCDTQQRLIKQHRQQDRRDGFDLKRAPLMRFFLARLSDAQWFFMWSSHHLILDRWCLTTIFKDFNSAYHKINTDAAAVQMNSATFRTYIDWIHRQDRGEASNFWQHHLSDIQQPTRLARSADLQDSAAEPKPGNAQASLTGNAFEQARTFAKNEGITIGVLIQGAWALTLNHFTHCQDIIFGAAVSGRPPELPDIESTVGSFINNVPVRVQLPNDRSMSECLKQIQSVQFGRAAFEYLSPAEIFACASFRNAKKASALYDTLIVWLAPNQSAQPRDLPMQALSSAYATNYPVTLSVEEYIESVILHIDSSVITSTQADRVVSHLLEVLTQIVSSSASLRLNQINGYFCDENYLPTSASAVRAAVMSAPVSLVNTGAMTVTEGAQYGREDAHAEILEDLLMAAWREVLDCDELVAGADFFAQGGTSIQATLLHAKIEAATRKSVPLMALFNRPTVSGMVETLMRQDWPLQAKIATGLRTGQQTRPLFCIASPEVNTIGYSLLTRYLPENKNVYVVQSPPVSGNFSQLHPTELQALATKYLAAMREIDSEGPYQILTMCAGSHISMEIVRQLEADNQSVSFVGVINTWAMYTISKLYYLNRFFNVARYYRSRLAGILKKPRSAAPLLAGNAVNSTPQISKVARAAIETGINNPWISQVGFANLDPKRTKVNAPVTVFRLRRQQFWRIRDIGLGWSKHSNTVTVVGLAGDDHDAMMREPNIQKLADAINLCLINIKDNSGGH